MMEVYFEPWFCIFDEEAVCVKLIWKLTQQRRSCGPFEVED